MEGGSAVHQHHLEEIKEKPLEGLDEKANGGAGFGNGSGHPTGLHR